MFMFLAERICKSPFLLVVLNPRSTLNSIGCSEKYFGLGCFFFCVCESNGKVLIIRLVGELANV